ncbi:hypothetical protein SAZ10_18220 [Mesorhizobium sp. BAC0120]|nr:hypothetical protein [Mesorhizobium sp. BAC0120]MDW6023688.1 hypothetical protein [Mesorhizobium sp. BAC0120]
MNGFLSFTRDAQLDEIAARARHRLTVILLLDVWSNQVVPGGDRSA